jgi:hypothetical protein
VTDLLDVTWIVAQALEGAGVLYTVGGSLASSFSGEPRASIDADILIRMTDAQVTPFVTALGEAFYAPDDALRRAVAERSSANIIHRPTGIKVDLFVPASLLDMHQLERRRPVRISDTPERHVYMHSPEDILLQKMHWYRLGGEVSERQWRDVLSILAVQGPRLDLAYVRATAGAAGLSALLARAQGEVLGRTDST